MNESTSAFRTANGLWIGLRRKSNDILTIMKKKEKQNSMFEMCPIRNVIARFGNKWGFLVLLVISEHDTIRFSELSRAIPDISTRVLSSTLRTLEADDLITRKIYPEIPPRVEYSLTPIGKELLPIVKDLTAWASKNLPTIIKHRQKFEE